VEEEWLAAQRQAHLDCLVARCCCPIRELAC